MVDEWDAWGDEREVQRRKADRKRANLPLELRRSQVEASKALQHAKLLYNNSIPCSTMHLRSAAVEM